MNHTTNHNNRFLDLVIIYSPDAFSLRRAIPIGRLTHTILPLRFNLHCIQTDFQSSKFYFDQFLYDLLYDIINQQTLKIKARSSDDPISFSSSLVRIFKLKTICHCLCKRFKIPGNYDTFPMLRFRVKSLLQSCCKLKELFT